MSIDESGDASNIKELVQEAERSLREADPLCVDANVFYAELRLLIEQATVLWARILFLHAAQQDQLQSMGNICVVVRNGVKKAQSECKTHVKAMKKSRSELRTLLSTLKATKVDKAFMGNKNLYEYVHEEDIMALDSQVDVLADQLLKSVSEIEHTPDTIQNLLADIRDKAPGLPEVMKSAIPKQMVKLTSKATPYANDMADLLTSLTRHYDLCSQIPQLSSEEAAQALEVVVADREQVTKASDRLKECRSQLRHKHREAQRLQHSLDMSFENLRSFEDRCAMFITDELRPALLKVSEKHTECQSLFAQVNAVVNEINGLMEYYRLFRRSYHALVVEVARRQESSKQLRKIIENANNAIRGFKNRESDARTTFLSTYQDFLPKELWPNMSEMPKEYSIEFVPESLPELEESTLAIALNEAD